MEAALELSWRCSCTSGLYVGWPAMGEMCGCGKLSTILLIEVVLMLAVRLCLALPKKEVVMTDKCVELGKLHEHHC